MALRARILAQGDEITTGATADTNSAWLARELTARGVRVVGFAAAPDDPDLLAALFAEAGRDADLVVSTGGLGPTDDDRSAEAAARAAGVGLAERQDALAQVEARFRAIGRPMGPSNRKQAVLPEGSELLENPSGTAPGFALDLGQARAFFFPGVPRELHVMAERHLFPWLAARGARPGARLRLHVAGTGESALQDRLRDVELAPGVRLGYKTWLPFNTVVLYADPGLPDPQMSLERARAAVLARIGEEVFGEDDETLSGAVGALLCARGLTLALAESCTAGLASALATEAAGSSRWFAGGIVCYANSLKVGLLGVDPAILAAHGAVSEATAAAMAEGVRRATGAAVGGAITGIAGPGGGSPDRPVGLVCFALAGLGETVARRVPFGDRGRDVVRQLAAAHLLEWLRRRLRDRPAARPGSPPDLPTSAGSQVSGPAQPAVEK